MLDHLRFHLPLESETLKTLFQISGLGFGVEMEALV